MADRWGPQARRAAISATFETLGDGTPGAGVSPALPAVLQILSERELSATFFIQSDMAAEEPLALTMIAAGQNKIGALIRKAGELPRMLGALGSRGGTPRGARAADQASLPPGAELREASLRYTSAPGKEIKVDGRVIRIPFDVRLRDMAQEHAGAWHEALQVAIGRALEHRAHLTLTFFPGTLERRDALTVFVETLDLIVGLRRAERLWIPTLDELARWWLDQQPSA